VDVNRGQLDDGQIAALDLAALTDDRGYFPPYQADRSSEQRSWRNIRRYGPALAELGGKISDAEMRRLNALADVEHQDIAEIARACCGAGTLRRLLLRCNAM